MWVRAVWREGDHEEEGVVPFNWIKDDLLLWPPGVFADKAIKEKREPTVKWRTFRLVKIKMRSESRSACEAYDGTTAMENSDSDSDNENKRKRKKKAFKDFVTGVHDEDNEMTLPEEPEKVVPKSSKIGLPVPPAKLKHLDLQSSFSQSSTPRSSSPIHVKRRVSTSESLPQPQSSTSKTIQRMSRSPNSASERSRSRSMSPFIVKRPVSRSDALTHPKLSVHRSGSTSVRIPRSPNSSLTRSHSRSPDKLQHKNTKSSTIRGRSQSPLCKAMKSSSTSNFNTRRSRSRSHSFRNRSPLHKSSSQYRSISPTWSIASRSRSRSRSVSPMNETPPNYHRSRSTNMSRSNSRSHTGMHHSRSYRSRSNSRSKHTSRSNSLREDETPRNSKRQKTSAYPMLEEKFQKRVMYMLTDIRHELSTMKKGYSSMPSGSGITQTDSIPQRATSLEEFNALEETLKHADKRQNLIDRLSTVGGLNLKDNVKKILEKLMDNELMSLFNMNGKKGKMAFVKTALCPVVRASALKTFEGTEHDVDVTIGASLKYAPDRRGGGGRKKDT